MAGNFSLGEAVLGTAVDQTGLKTGLGAAQATTKQWSVNLSTLLAGVVGGAIGSVITKVIGSITKAIGDFAAGGLLMNESLELIEARLQTLTGEGEKTLKWVKELAVQTPFTTQSLASALALAKAMGFTTEEAKKLIVTVGNVDAAMGGQGQTMISIVRVLGQMKSAGKVMSQDMLQLTSAGIPAWKLLADAMGLSVAELRDLVSKGLVPASEAIPILTEAMDKQFGNALENAAQAAAGLREALGETIDLAAAEVTFPLFLKMKETLSEVLDVLSGGPFQQAVDDLASLFADLASGFDPTAISAALSRVVDSVAEALSFIRQLRDELSGVTSAQIMAGARVAILGVHQEMFESLGKLKTQHETTIASIQGQIEGVGSSMAKALASIEEKYADKTAGLSKKLEDIHTQFTENLEAANEKLAVSLEKNQADLQDRLLSLTERFAEKQASIEASIAQKRVDFARSVTEKVARFEDKLQDRRDRLSDKIEDIRDKSADKRQDLQERLTKAIWAEEKAAVQAQIDELDKEEAAEIAKLESREAREVKKLQKRHDRELKALKKKQNAQLQILKDRLKKEEKAFNAATAKENARAAERAAQIQADHMKAVEDLKVRLEEEDMALNEQLGKIGEDRAKEEAAVSESHGKQLASLQGRLEAENIAYAEQKEQLETDAEDEKTRIMETAEAREKALGTGPAAELADVLKGLHDKYGDVIDDTIEWAKESDILENALVALTITGVIALTAAAIALLPTLWPIILVGAILAGTFLLILGVVSLLRKIWEEDFLGIRTALETAWNKIKPKLEELQEKLEDKLPEVLAKLKKIWDEKLKEPFETIVGIIKDSLLPALGDEDGLIGIIDDLLDTLIWLLDNAVDPAIIAFELWAESVSTSVQQVEDLFKWLDKLSNTPFSVQLADYMLPGSPTPFELGLRGINDALSDLTRQGLPSLGLGLSGATALAPSLAGAGAGGGGDTVNLYGDVLVSAESGLQTREEGEAVGEGIIDGLSRKGITP